MLSSLLAKGMVPMVYLRSAFSGSELAPYTHQHTNAHKTCTTHTLAHIHTPHLRQRGVEPPELRSAFSGRPHHVTQLRAHTHSFFQIHHLQKKVPSRVVILLMLASAHACSQSSNAFTYKHSFLANHHSIMG